ncbi:MAG: NHLP bacteriocin system secretion protein, partial [Oscillospiraceae bacterium]
TLVTIADATLSEDILRLQERIEKVNAVTFTSVSDEITADTQQLAEIKIEYATANSGIDETTHSLAASKTELAAAQAAEKDAASRMDTAKATYYSLLGISGDSAVQREYEDAKSALEQIQAEVQELQGLLAAAQQAYDKAVDDYVAHLYTKATSGRPSIAEFKDLMQTAPVSPYNYYTLGQFAYLGCPPGGTLIPDVANELWAEFNLQSQNLATATSTVTPALDAAAAQLAAAQTRFAAAESAYWAESDKTNGRSIETQKAQNEYQVAQSAYSTAQQTRISIEQQTKQLETQLQVEREKAQDAIWSLQERFNAAKLAISSQLEEELDKYTFEMEKTSIPASFDGVVTSLLVKPGTLVTAGTELVRVEPSQTAESPGNVVVCYIPLESGKKVQPGMQVMVYPTTVNRQEYGYVYAEVIAVDNYVTSQSKLQTQLNDESLVNSFMQDGPVVAVTCRLETDASTASGYRWSSKKGADVTLNEGTIVNANIVTEEKAPITMLIPLLKDKLNISQN